MTDPISDMLTRIRNAQAVKKQEIILPMSNLKFELAKILEKDGWVIKTEVVKDEADTKNNFKDLKITLKYKKSGRPAISSIKRISKPGLRIYVGKDKLPRVLNNMGIAVLSTPQGLMTNKEARKKGVGGEILCEIY